MEIFNLDDAFFSIESKNYLMYLQNNYIEDYHLFTPKYGFGRFADGKPYHNGALIARFRLVLFQVERHLNDLFRNSVIRITNLPDT